MTVEMGKGLPVGQAVLASGVSFDAPKHIFLMLFILTDMKRPDTFFRPYYDLLPTTLSNMPIFWSEDEMKLLKGSYLVTQVGTSFVRRCVPCVSRELLLWWRKASFCSFARQEEAGGGKGKRDVRSRAPAKKPPVLRGARHVLAAYFAGRGTKLDFMGKEWRRPSGG